MGQFTSQGLRLAYEVIGDGPPIVLVHGFASSIRQNWREPGWIDALTAAGRQVIALDNRGHGASDKPHDVDSYGIDVMAADVLGLVDHLGLSGAAGRGGIDLFGYSMGAYISLRLILRAPDLWRRVILGGIGGAAVNPTGDLTLIPEAMRADRASLRHPIQVAFRAFAESQGNDLEALAACASRPRVPVRRADYEGLALPEILVVAGETDDLTGDQGVLLDALPGSRGAIIPRRNHMTAVGDAQTRRVVLDFLRD